MADRRHSPGKKRRPRLGPEVPIVVVETENTVHQQHTNIHNTEHSPEPTTQEARDTLPYLNRQHPDPLDYRANGSTVYSDTLHSRPGSMVPDEELKSFMSSNLSGSVRKYSTPQTAKQDKIQDSTLPYLLRPGLDDEQKSPKSISRELQVLEEYSLAPGPDEGHRSCKSRNREVQLVMSLAPTPAPDEVQRSRKSSSRELSALREHSTNNPHVLKFVYSKEVERSLRSQYQSSALPPISAVGKVGPQVDISHLEDIYQDFVTFRHMRRHNVEREMSWKVKDMLHTRKSTFHRLSISSIVSRMQRPRPSIFFRLQQDIQK